MKKLTKKLFISVMTLVLTAMALGTSTFAWFSMNTTAVATGMQVNAKSNATYLLITDGNTAEKITAAQSGVQVTVAAAFQQASGTQTTFSVDDYNAKKVYPCAYTTAAIQSTVENVTTTHVAANNWYTASNGVSNQATGTEKNYKVIDLGNKNYMLEYKVWLVLSADSENFNGQIKVTYAKTAGDDAVSACVVFGDTPATGEQLRVKTGSTEATSTTSYSIGTTAATALQATVYIYIDGTSTNVNSTYFITNGLTGTCSITFDLVMTNN